MGPKNLAVHEPCTEDSPDRAGGFVRGPVGVTERVHRLNTLREIEHRAPVTAWHDTPDDSDLAPLYVQMPNGELQAIDHHWESYDDVDADWLYLPPEAGLSVTEKGWRSLDEALSTRFAPPPSLAATLIPILAAELCDTAVREMSVQLEHAMRGGCGNTDAYGQKLVYLFVQSIARKQDRTGDLLLARLSVVSGNEARRPRASSNSARW
jgi:hypothetical protein